MNVLLSFLDSAAKKPAVSDQRVRKDKVAKVRERLAAGTYHVGSAQVAEKILNKAVKAKLSKSDA